MKPALHSSPAALESAQPLAPSPFHSYRQPSSPTGWQQEPHWRRCLPSPGRKLLPSSEPRYPMQLLLQKRPRRALLCWLRVSFLPVRLTRLLEYVPAESARTSPPSSRTTQPLEAQAFGRSEFYGTS